MPFISLTRLRIRSIRFMPFFALHAWRSIRQIKRAPGFLTGALLPDKDRTFWTMTAWDSEENMRSFMISGSHKAAMPHLVEWCDEASVTHWTEPDTPHPIPNTPHPIPHAPSETPDPRPQTLPSWSEADQRMRSSGRASKIKHPSPNHATLSYKPPRITPGGKITRS
jgi:heme-degrading monooxygenase HmoA